MQQELEYIYTVYNEKNFSKAAKKLYITQPALSMAVQKTEKALGMPIFDRSTRPLSLTAAGEIYINYINQIQNLEQELEEQINDIKNINSGSITIGGSHYINSCILPDILSDYSKRYPNIEIRLLETSSSMLSEMLSARKIDLTLNCNQNFVLNFKHIPAFHDRILLAVPKSDPINNEIGDMAISSAEAAAGKHLTDDCPSIPLKKFENMEFIILSKGNNLHEISNMLFSEAGFSPTIKLMLSQLATAYHLANASIGATFVSDRLITSAEDALLYYKLQSQLTRRQFYILLPNKRYTSMAVRAFIDCFKEHYAS